MKKDSLKANKKQLRDHFRTVRAAISLVRREQAAAHLSKTLDLQGNILSFASFGTEIDLWPLNFRLAKENRLFLPRVVGDHLSICPVTDPAAQLQRSNWGILEPTTKPIDAQIDIILVPGLAFDKRGHRLGYGKGHYDRLDIRGRRIGIAFEEQLTDLLPNEPHDIALDFLMIS